MQLIRVKMLPYPVLFYSIKNHLSSDNNRWIPNDELIFNLLLQNERNVTSTGCEKSRNFIVHWSTSSQATLAEQ